MCDVTNPVGWVGFERHAAAWLQPLPFRSDFSGSHARREVRRDAEGTVRNGKKAGGRDGCVQSPRPERVQLLTLERLPTRVHRELRVDPWRDRRLV
jgi:hypothetical protein